eukprot:gene11605-4848_t
MEEENKFLREKITRDQKKFMTSYQLVKQKQSDLVKEKADLENKNAMLKEEIQQLKETSEVEKNQQKQVLNALKLQNESLMKLNLELMSKEQQNEVRVPETTKMKSNDETKRKGEVYLYPIMLPFENKKLADIYSRFGKVSRVKIIPQRNGSHVAFSFIHFDDERDAIDAVKVTNGTDFVQSGQKLIVRIAESLEDEDQQKTEEKVIPLTNLYVNPIKLPFRTSELCKKFSIFGQVTYAKIIPHKTSETEAYAHVHFKEEKDAKRAIDKTYNTFFLQDSVRVRSVFAGNQHVNRESSKTEKRQLERNYESSPKKRKFD